MSTRGSRSSNKLKDKQKERLDEDERKARARAAKVPEGGGGAQRRDFKAFCLTSQSVARGTIKRARGARAVIPTI